MQSMQLLLEGEGGGKIAESDINFADIINALDENSKDKYPWLWGVDPYGLTVFNLHQTPHVIAELKQLYSGVQDEDLKTVVNKAIDFISKIKQHTYIKLIGD